MNAYRLPWDVQEIRRIERKLQRQAKRKSGWLYKVRRFFRYMKLEMNGPHKATYCGRYLIHNHNGDARCAICATADYKRLASGR